MPPNAKRRKVAGQPAVALPASKSIRDFTTTVRKSAHVARDDAVGKPSLRSAAVARPSTKESGGTLAATNPKPSRKIGRPVSPRGKAKTKKAALPTSSPSSTSSSTPTEITPTRGATAVLSSLHLSSSSSTPSPRKRGIEEIEQRPEDLIKQIQSSQSKAAIADAPDGDEYDEQLPQPIVDLLGLASSFFSALSLYFAHHGAAVPADLRALLPSVSRVWGRRTVAVEDVQRIIGVLGQGGRDDSKAAATTMRLTDFGTGRVCVELEDDETTKKGRKAGRIAMRPIDEDRLYAAFEIEVRRLWKVSDGDEAVEFIRKLSKAHLEPCRPLRETSSLLLAKGQSRLEAFQVGVAERKEREAASKTITKGKAGKGKSLSDRRQELAQRIQAKGSLKQSTIDPAEMRRRIQRKAAAHRLLEVAAVVRHLGGTRDSQETPSSSAAASSSYSAMASSKGSSRVSLPLATLLGHVQSSTKVPASKDEVTRSVRLLSEVAPAWVTLVKVGQVEAVIVSRENRVHDSELAERLKKDDFMTV